MDRLAEYRDRSLPKVAPFVVLSACVFACGLDLRGALETDAVPTEPIPSGSAQAVRDAASDTANDAGTSADAHVDATVPSACASCAAKEVCLDNACSLCGNDKTGGLACAGGGSCSKGNGQCK